MSVQLHGIGPGQTVLKKSTVDKKPGELVFTVPQDIFPQMKNSSHKCLGWNFLNKSMIVIGFKLNMFAFSYIQAVRPI